jgi:hypothetical protein
MKWEKNPQNLVIEVFILKKSMQTPSYRALVMGVCIKSNICRIK